MATTIPHGKVVVQCFRFMRLFGVSMFSQLSCVHDQVHALVAWPDASKAGLPSAEDVQEIAWTAIYDEALDDALYLGECVYDAKGISSDRLIMSQEQMQEITGWDSEKVRQSTELLLSIRVQKIDNGNTGDVFFLHK